MRKDIFFAIVFAVTVFVGWNNERFLLDPQATEWAHYDPIRWQLLPHGLGGSLALALGALQFSTRFRRRYSALHRMTGRIYIGGTFVAAPVAIWMAFINSPWFLVPFTVVQSTTWPEIALAGKRRRRRTEGDSPAMNTGALAPTSPGD